MTDAKDFRRIVLGLRGAIEGAHMGHPDFRGNGRIFASLNGDQTRGMVVLTPDQQQRFVHEHPAVFQPESGAWGRAGCTRVHFDSLDEETLGEALTVAWQNSMPRGPAPPKAKTAAIRPASSATPARRRAQKLPLAGHRAIKVR
jgi:hypothetical protein